jgi:hypothetical protein
MKRLISLITIVFLAAAISFAATKSPYRIALRNGGVILSKDKPVHRGSVLMFHTYPRGTLTSIPEEEVAGLAPTIRASVDQVTVTAPPALAPGDVIVLGPTGGNEDGATAAPSASSAAPQFPGGVYDPRNPMYGYSPPRAGTVGAGTVIVPGMSGDLGRAPSGPPPTTETLFGPNGFPATGAASPPIGPDGQPILASPGTPGSTPPQIGPNGTPILAPPGAPGSTPPPVGPNGYPAPPK